MIRAELWTRYLRQGQNCSAIWAEIHRLDDTGVGLLDQRMQILLDRAHCATAGLMRLYDMLPEGGLDREPPPEPAGGR